MRDKIIIGESSSIIKAPSDEFFKMTGLESCTDKDLMDFLDHCSGRDTPFIVEILRRLWKYKISKENQSQS